jgi:hypothetical protein
LIVSGDQAVVRKVRVKIVHDEVSPRIQDDWNQSGRNGIKVQVDAGIDIE